MSPVRRHGDGFDRATLRTNRAPGAIVENTVFDERRAFAGGAAALEMGFVFVTKIAERGQHRVRSSFAKTTETPSADLSRQ